MTIKSIEGGFDKNLSYLLWCDITRIAIIIDPAIETTYFKEIIEKNNLMLNKILITHTHHDHIMHLDSYLYLYPNAQIICHEQHIKKFSFPIIKIADYEIISFGEESLIGIHTPGHYADSMCYWDKTNQLIFTGDTIFVGRTGRTKSNYSNIDDLYNSVYNKILTLPKNTTIFPGHNYGFKKTISIKENIQHSNFFSCNSLNEFKIIMKKFESNR
tara:strand:+ start:991 stop:1635 length:645 start_codon:yes stop_codon:yes gene_type:complete